MDWEKKNSRLRFISPRFRWLLLLLSILIFLFALLSGSEDQEGNITISGIFYKFPNAIPWVVLFLITWLPWKHKLCSGIVLILF